MSYTALPEEATISLYMNYHHKVTLGLPKIRDQKLLTFHGCSFSAWGRERVSSVFAPNGDQFVISGCLQPIPTWITQYAKLSIFDALLTLIVRLGQ